MTRIAVAGGTGVVGVHVVEAVRALGHEPVVLSRSHGVDVTSGSGLPEALAGVDAVVDVTNVTTLSRSTSVGFFETATTHLLAAEKAAGVRHHVALSIVGIDRVGLPYYIGKRRQEEIALAVPTTSVLRATQFHEFAGQLIDRGGPVTVVPKMRSQPIAAREVGVALAELALAEPAGLLPDLAGPEQHWMHDLVRRVRDARGSRRPVMSFRLPGKVGAGLAGGGLLPRGDGPRGRETFEEWLSGRAQPGTA
jgi:uncharacterized protein YbjT (DUF2867 family)